MTLQLPAIDRIDDGSEVHWKSPAAGLWVASRRGEHAGMVERLDGAYHVRNARGRALGSFPELDSAFAAIDGGGGDSEVAPRAAKALLILLHGGAALTALALALLLIR